AGGRSSSEGEPLLEGSRTARRRLPRPADRRGPAVAGGPAAGPRVRRPGDVPDALALARRHRRSGAHARRAVRRDEPGDPGGDGGPTGAEPAGLLEAAAGGGPEAIGPLLQNDLEGPVTARHPAVRDALDLLVTAGCAGVVMCGSGPSVAGLLPAGGGGFDAA